jgi:hypothetical protein
VARDILGIGLVVIAIAVAIAVWFGIDAPVPALLRLVLVRAVGVGASAIPLMLLVWAISMVFDHRQVSETAIGIGLALIFLAVIAMFSAAVPFPSAGGPVGVTWTGYFTAPGGGGYLGGAVAWALTVLLSQVIAYVVLSGMLLIGLVLATGIGLVDVWNRVTGMFRRDDAGPAPRTARLRPSPNARTVPLEDLDSEVQVEPVPRPRAHRTRSSRAPRPSSSPRSRRSTSRRAWRIGSRVRPSRCSKSRSPRA